MHPIHHTNTRAIGAAWVVLLLAACADQPTTAPALRSNSPNFRASFSSAATKPPSDHVMIETKGAESSGLTAALTSLGVQIERRLPEVNVIVAKSVSASAAAALAARSDVAHVTPDMRLRWLPTVPLQKSSGRLHTPPVSHVDQSGAFFFPTFQWNMKVTKANQAWLTTPEGNGAKVYVLDTGIDPTHSDLVGLVDLTKSTSFAEAEPTTFLDFESHGTFVSAIIVSNGLGVASVAPLAKLVAVKVLDATGSGSFADVISGIIYAANQGADVINMSLGAIVDATDPDTQTLLAHMQAAIAYARLKGSVVVAAAGNEDLNLLTLPPQFLSVPAELIGVLSIGATAPVNQMNFDQIASYSNFGYNGFPIGGVQVFAPGGDLVAGGVITDLIISACSQFSPFGCGPNDYLIGAGTSFSSPMVSGESAVLRSILGSSALASFANVNCVLSGTDAIGPSSIFGKGRMNVVKAANCAHH